MIGVQPQGRFAILYGPGELATFEIPDGPLVVRFGIIGGLADQFVEIGAGLELIAVAGGLQKESVLIGRAAPKPDFPQGVGSKTLYDRVIIAECGGQSRIDLDGPNKPEGQHRGAARFRMSGGEQSGQCPFSVSFADAHAELANRLLYRRPPRVPHRRQA